MRMAIGFVACLAGVACGGGTTTSRIACEASSNGCNCSIGSPPNPNAFDCSTILIPTGSVCSRQPQDGRPKTRRPAYARMRRLSRAEPRALL